MTNPVQIGDATLYLGDCLEILPTLGKVDCVVTSPPYGQQRDYGAKISDWRALVSGAITATPAHETTQILVNLGLIHSNGEVVPYWQDLIDDMRTDGWRHFGWYVWDKGFGLPGNWSGRLGPAHEFVFHFNKQSIEVTKWVKTKGYNHGGAGLRRPDGSLSGISSPDKIGQAFKVSDSVLRITPHQARGGLENQHPAIFPIELPNSLIRSFSTANDTILDPFMGSGTTGVACAKLGRKFIGVEIEEKYFDIACARIEEAYKQRDLFINVETEHTKAEQMPLLREDL